MKIQPDLGLLLISRARAHVDSTFTYSVLKLVDPLLAPAN